jgi:hypothetical protein
MKQKEENQTVGGTQPSFAVIAIFNPLLVIWGFAEKSRFVLLPSSKLENLC